MTKPDAELETARLQPEAVYDHPSDVEHDDRLSLAEKISILQAWAHDENEKLVAETENMPGQKPNRLADVTTALNRLEAKT